MLTAQAGVDIMVPRCLHVNRRTVEFCWELRAPEDIDMVSWPELEMRTRVGCCPWTRVIATNEVAA